MELSAPPQGIQPPLAAQWLALNAAKTETPKRVSIHHHRNEPLKPACLVALALQRSTPNRAPGSRVASEDPGSGQRMLWANLT